MLKSMKSMFGRAFRSSRSSTSNNNTPIIVYDPVLGLRRRKYSTYEEYLIHQSEKLSEVGESIRRNDFEYEELLTVRYRDRFDFCGKSILCLGARLGGEVRAFKTLGALAVGIDIEPGPENCHVLHGDFHELLFPDSCCDFLFTNVIDHVYDLDRFVTEAYRVLKPQGIFLIEFGEVRIGRYEVLDTTSPARILARFERSFELIDQSSIVNMTSYINWNGRLLVYRKGS